MEIVDYRNGKYQGPLNAQRQRHGPGILLDDDLTFHASHWNRNALQGPTLLYLAHGKYMYGQWNHNQPQGLNVFRAGDTVLLCEFQEGAPSGKCLLIFERQSLAWVMEENEGEWKVLEGGPLPNHRALLSYLSGVGLKVPDHFFSLTKFVCSFSQNSKHIKTHPCGANNCYFGFLQGLAIIFNPSNAVVSVGYHRNQQLCEYGARFQGQTVSEGNFEPQGQVISYKGERRPTQQINNIFHGLHQRSINYDNNYLQSKSKLYGRIENLLRGKLQEIAERALELQLTNNSAIDDSLNYRQVDGEESMKLCEKRDMMYSPPKKQVEKHKVTSPCKEETKRKDEASTKLNSYSNRRPLRSPLRVRQNEQEGQSYCNKPSLPLQKGLLVEQPKLCSDFSRRAYLQKNSDIDNPFVKVKQDSQRSPTFKGLIEQMESKYRLNSQKITRKEGMDELIRKGSSRSKTKVIDLGQMKETENAPSEGLSALGKKSFDIKTIPRPSYEDIEERRKRVLREFKELNVPQTQKEKKGQSPVDFSAKKRKESLESSFGYVPLSITKKREKEVTPSKLHTVSQDENIQRKSEAKGKRPVSTVMEERINSRQQHNVLANSFQKIIETEVVNKRSEKKLNFDAVQVVETLSRSSSNQNSVSPSRQKKTYVYLFQ